MLIRFVINNILSFGKETEFNMFPSPRYTRHKEHLYTSLNFNILKMASLYGANGAGKSNLIKSLELMQSIVLNEEIPSALRSKKCKFSSENEKQLLAIEFVNGGKAFYYGLEFDHQKIMTEELYESGLGKKSDSLIFERKTGNNNKTTITFFENFEKDEEGNILKRIIEKNLSKPNKSILQLLSTLENSLLSDTNLALDWFQNKLEIITPDAKPVGLILKIDIDKEFHKHAEEIMHSFHTGITGLHSEKRTIKETFGEDPSIDIDNIIKEIEKSPNKMISIRKGTSGGEIILVKENDEIYVKQLKLEHSISDDKKILFDLDEESDGTIRLLDFVPAFKNLVNMDKVFFIDEIERSIHPLLIKELIRKFSADSQTKGQLIFTTHESNLLDQQIFRQDEIWFAEKTKSGTTDLYSLNDFKEHNTKDIRKGYLNGRYGSIPFLANLEDLNWNDDAAEK